MAYIRRYKATRGAKAFRRRPFRTPKRVFISRVKGRSTGSSAIRWGGSSRVPFALVKYTKLHLNFDVGITSTSGAFTGSDGLTINSLYDPTGAIGADQPRWFDQLSTLYNQYSVYGCKIVAVINNSEKAGQVGMGAYDASAPASFRELDERENCISRVIDQTGGSRTQVILKKYFNIPKIVGIPKKEYVTADDYLADVSSDPANKVYAKLFFQAYGGQTSSVNIKVHMTFYCRMSGLADPADS